MLLPASFTYGNWHDGQPMLSHKAAFDARLNRRTRSGATRGEKEVRNSQCCKVFTLQELNVQIMLQLSSKQSKCINLTQETDFF